jgi:hypothetical protein
VSRSFPARGDSSQDRTLILLAALIMAYGWGYRGIVGHEGGAMVPGALLGMAICLASGRPDWVRRTAVAGLFAAVGWAWGGSMSYMEQTFYTVSDSFPDVLYGYSVLFFEGALWAGIGGGALGLALTLPRSELDRLARPIAVLGAVYLAIFLFLFFNHTAKDLYDRISAQHFHDGDFFATLIALATFALYAALRPADRTATRFYLGACLAWLAGYLLLTRIGELQLGPPYRSESWGGVLGILIALLIYLVRSQNRAALLLCRYGILGGGLAFAAAVWIRHPVRVGWGPFASWGGMMQWKIAEESFGLLMGLAIGLGALRLLRGGLAAPEEDAPRKPLDIFSVFVVLVVLLWMNVRRAPERWMDRYELMGTEPVAGLAPWVWLLIAGLAVSALALQALRLYYRDALALAPATALGKGQWILLLLLWLTVGTGFAQHLPEAGSGGFPLVDMTFILLSAACSALLLAIPMPAQPNAHANTATASDDPRWHIGKGFYFTCGAVPVVLILLTGLSMGMQQGAAHGSRLRFGPNAYWRDAMAIMGHWQVTGTTETPSGNATGPAPADIVAIDFMRDRSAIVTLASGEQIVEAHTWFHADSRIHLDWYGRLADHEAKATVVMTLDSGNLYIPWPPDTQQNFLVLTRAP